MLTIADGIVLGVLALWMLAAIAAIALEILGREPSAPAPEVAPDVAPPPFLPCCYCDRCMAARQQAMPW